MTGRTLVVVTAGLTQPSSTRLLADRLATAAQTALSEFDIHLQPNVIELRNLAHEIMNRLLTGFSPAPLAPVVDAVNAADGLIAVTPVFNASYSGLFKSFFDTLDGTALADKPVLIAATGGTARHSLALEHALRPLFVYLGGVVVPTSVYAASEDWAAARAETAAREQGGDATEDVPGPEDGSLAGGLAPLHSRIRRAAHELAVLMSLRQPSAAADPFALTASFEEMIAGTGSTQQ